MKSPKELEKRRNRELQEGGDCMLLLQFYYKLISGMIFEGQPFSKYLLSIFYSLKDNYFGGKRWNSMPKGDMCEGSGMKPARDLMLFSRAKPGNGR